MTPAPAPTFNQRYEAVRNPSVETKPAEAATPENKIETPAAAAPAAEPAAPKQPDKPVEPDYKARAEQLERDLAEARKPKQETPAPRIEAPAGPTVEPKIDDKKADGTAKYASYEAYLTDLARYTVRQERIEQQQQEQQATQQKTLRERFDAAAAKHADFHEVAKKAQVPINGVTQDAIREWSEGGEIFYHLATHPEDARQLANLSPLATMEKLIELRQTFKAPAPTSQTAAPTAPPENKRPSRAPSPVQTLKPTSTPSEPTYDDIGKIADPRERMRQFTAKRAKDGQKDARRLVAING